MLNIQNKPHDDLQGDNVVDYSFLSRELMQLRQENSLYKRTVAQIRAIAEQVAAGDVTARIIHQDEFGDLAPVLRAVNGSYDFMDRVICELKATQQIDLIRIDDLRKAQLTEVAEFFRKQIVPVLDIIGKVNP